MKILFRNNEEEYFNLLHRFNLYGLCTNSSRASICEWSQKINFTTGHVILSSELALTHYTMLCGEWFNWESDKGAYIWCGGQNDDQKNFCGSVLNSLQSTARDFIKFSGIVFHLTRDWMLYKTSIPMKIIRGSFAATIRYNRKLFCICWRRKKLLFYFLFFIIITKVCWIAIKCVIYIKQ
jgi:hypothetical protein